MKKAILLIGLIVLIMVLGGCIEQSPIQSPSTQYVCPDETIVNSPELCSQPPTGCPEDTMVCPDGSTVSRNLDNNCNFDPCIWMEW